MKVSQLTYVVPPEVNVCILHRVSKYNHETLYKGNPKRLPKDSKLNGMHVHCVQPVSVELLYIYI